MHFPGLRKIQPDTKSLSPARTVEDSSTDSETEALQHFEKDVQPLYLLHRDTLLTRSVHQWYHGVEKHQKVLKDWFVVKVEHRKNFHYSAVFHEHLRVTLRRRSHNASTDSTDPQDGQKPPVSECTIYLEREVDRDEVTIGCQPQAVPALSGWWIVRLLRGNYSDAGGGGGVESTAGFSSTPRWRETTYCASDFMRSLEFADGVVSLLEFAKVVRKWSRTRRDYDVARANCFWFANIVYVQLEHDWNGRFEETRGSYVKHMGRFSGLRILFNSVSSAHASLCHCTCIDLTDLGVLVFPSPVGWRKAAKRHKSYGSWQRNEGYCEAV